MTGITELRERDTNQIIEYLSMRCRQQMTYLKNSGLSPKALQTAQLQVALTQSFIGELREGKHLEGK